jgi:hypothetical protein
MSSAYIIAIKGSIVYSATGSTTMSVIIFVAVVKSY